MPKSKLEQIQYERFYEVVESPINRVWSVSELLRRINMMLTTNLELNENGIRSLIGKQQRYRVFRCAYTTKEKRKIYYIFRRGIPIENANLKDNK